MVLDPPFERLKCRRCDEAFSFPSQTFSYTTRTQPQGEQDGEFVVHPMLTTRTWCIACNAPSYIERIPSLREFEAAAALVRNQENLLQLGIEDDLLQFGLEYGVKALLVWQARLSGRASLPKCLMCGSRRLVSRGRESHLKHEGCEGDLYLEQYYIPHCVGRGPFRFYSWSGEFLWEQSEQYTPAALGSLDPPDA
jgi:hypothetical protein